MQEHVGGTTTVNRLMAGTDQTLLRTDATGTTAPLTDARASVIGLVDADGSVATAYTYDPYGNVTTTGAASSNTQQYTGREYDSATGLVYDRARYYSPESGRFISQDPAGLSGGSTNIYQYALDNPINLSDPTGACPDCTIDPALATKNAPSGTTASMSCSR